MAAANDLSLLGYEVTIFEALPVLGGMLAVGIPGFRLPRDILNMEIDGIQELGVEMKTNHRFLFDGNGRSFQKLGFQAAFLSVGAHRSSRLSVPGEKLEGVLPGVEFLRCSQKASRSKDCVSAAGRSGPRLCPLPPIRLGAGTVEIYYRRSRDEMPAIPEEVEEATARASGSISSFHPLK